MTKDEILNKVKEKEDSHQAIIDDMNWQQRCISQKVCPKCGDDLVENTQYIGRHYVDCFYYHCKCNYKIEVNSYNIRKIIWPKTKFELSTKD